MRRFLCACVFGKKNKITEWQVSKNKSPSISCQVNNMMLVIDTVILLPRTNNNRSALYCFQSLYRWDDWRGFKSRVSLLFFTVLPRACDVYIQWRNGARVLFFGARGRESSRHIKFQSTAEGKNNQTNLVTFTNYCLYFLNSYHYITTGGALTQPSEQVCISFFFSCSLVILSRCHFIRIRYFN